MSEVKVTQADREAAYAAVFSPHSNPSPHQREWIEKGCTPVSVPWPDCVRSHSLPEIAEALVKAREAALADPKLVLEAANRLLCCAVNDRTGLIAAALESGAEISLAIRNVRQ